MSEFVRGATGIVEVAVEGDISGSTNMELWLNTFSEIVAHERNDLTSVKYADGYTTIKYKLTQRESLSCCEDYVAVQLRWTNDAGTVGATKKQYVRIYDADWDDTLSVEAGGETDTSDITRIPEAEILNMLEVQDALTT